MCSYVELGCARKNLEGAGDIEDLATRRAEQDDRLCAARRGSLSRGIAHTQRLVTDGDGSNDKRRSVSAIA
jgi:hypothetical protein